MLQLVPPLVLLFGLCSDCEGVARFGELQSVYLPLLGLFAASAALVGRGDFRDFVVLLGGIAGLLLIATTWIVGVTPCPWCWMFWGLWAIQLTEVLLSGRRLARVGCPALVATAACCVALATSPYFKTMAVATARDAFPFRLGGLRPGARLPEVAALAGNGISVFASNCPTCWTGRMTKILADFQSKGIPYNVLIATGSPVPKWAVLDHTVTVSKEIFARCNLETKGIPYILEHRNGRVFRGRFASELEK